MTSTHYVPWQRRAWLLAVASLVLLFLLLPALLVIPMSFSSTQVLQFPPQQWSLRWYRSYFVSTEWQSATGISLQAAILTTLLATPLGTLAAYSLRVAPHRYAHWVLGLIVTPLIVPGILIAIAIFFVYARLGLNNSLLGLVAAHTMLALPLVFITTAAAFKQFDMDQELVARSLGSSRLRAFLTVTLPQIRFSVYVAAFLAFISSFDEVIVAMFISGGANSTLPRRMFNELRSTIDPTIAAISSLLIVLAIVVFVVVRYFERRSLTRSVSGSDDRN